MSIFGTQLQKLRAERGISLSVLSKAIGVDRSTLYRWEHNLTSPKSFEIISLVANFFDVSPDYFFNIQYVELKAEIHRLREELNSLHKSVNHSD